jgi:hypothetical protein
MHKTNKQRQQRRAAGLCALCGKVRSGGYACADCQKKNRQRKAKNKTSVTKHGAVMANELSKSEQEKLDALEKRFERGIFDAGDSLRTIRDERLYRATSNTFEEYCAKRWNFSDSRANQLIQAVEVRDEISAQTENSQQLLCDGPSLPENEAQAREVAKAPKGERAKVWKKAVASAPKSNGKPKVTAAHVRRVVREESTNGEHDSNGEVANPWDEFNASLDEIASELRSASKRLFALLGYEAGSTYSKVKWGRALDKRDTTDVLNDVIAKLKKQRPHQLNAKKPGGFMTVIEAEEYEQQMQAIASNK